MQIIKLLNSMILESITLSMLIIVSVATRADNLQGNPVAVATRTNIQVPMDGNITSPTWLEAKPITLIQQSPKPGGKSPYFTTIRILRGTSKIYFGITCINPKPSDIAIHTLQRDGDLTNDSNVTIVLDTFNQKKLAYVFQVNAGGAMSDGLISPAASLNGVNYSIDYGWDGYWRAVSRKTDDGWTAEIEIDTQSLQFGNNAQMWGMNISRYVPSVQQTLIWSGDNLNASVTNLQWEGTLAGVDGLEQGNGLEFDPYALIKYDDVSKSSNTKVGGDIKYNFSPHFKGLFTYNTDFAEAEADQEQVNLTQYPLFFPEKRAFFLEGSNIYSFGHNLGTNFIPFYSRTIGLQSGTVIPLDEGLKLIGTTGKWNLGMIDTQMGSSNVSSATNLFAGRASYDLSNQWRVGTLVTHGDPSGISDNSLVSFDSTWSTSKFNGDKNLNVSEWAARSYGDLGPGTPNGYGFDVEYPNDLWYFDTNYNYYGDALNPALGFLPRPGTKQYFIQGVYQPRPSAKSSLSWIRQLYFNGYYSMVTDLGDNVQSKLWSFSPVQFTAQNGYIFEWLERVEYENVAYAFNVAPGVAIPTGEYNFTSNQIVLITPQSRPLVWTISAENDGYYTGRLQNYQIGFTWSQENGKFYIGLNTEQIFGYLPDGNFVERIHSLSMGYSFTPNLELSNYMQYNNITKNTAWNTRLQWNIAPAKSLYVVWNHGLETNPDLLNANNVVSGNNVIVKLVWGIY